MFLLNQFWAPRKSYEPCGMFTEGHMVLLLLSIVLLVGLLYISRSITHELVKRVVRVLAVIITALEAGKICFNFYWRYTWVNAWFPMAYCSIFIYALWLSGYGRGKWREMGDAFLAGTSMVAGATYLLFPSTALTMYPIGHYLALYSMIFHTLMMYVGILYIRKLNFELNRERFNKYVRIYLLFATIAIVLNTIFESNLMFLSEPGKVPLEFLHAMYASSPIMYTIFIFMVYLIVPYYVTVYLSKFIRNNEKRKQFNQGDKMISVAN